MEENDNIDHHIVVNQRKWRFALFFFFFKQFVKNCEQNDPSFLQWYFNNRRCGFADSQYEFWILNVSNGVFVIETIRILACTLIGWVNNSSPLYDP